MSRGETSGEYLESRLFGVFTSWSCGSMPPITPSLGLQRNVWPIRNAGEPGFSFISPCRNVCWVNFLHQSWLIGGDFPLVSNVSRHAAAVHCRWAVRDKRNEFPLRILGCGRSCIYAVKDNISIVHAAFMGLYFIHEFLRTSNPRLTSCVCTCKRRKLFHLPAAVAGFQNTPDVWTFWPAEYDWWLSE